MISIYEQKKKYLLKLIDNGQKDNWIITELILLDSEYNHNNGRVD